MQRRAFFTLLGGAAAMWPLAVSAQQAGRMRRIGVLMALEENDPEGKAQLSGFTQGLSELGWTNGSNLRIEVRWGGGDVNQIRTFAKELVAAQPDLILSQGTPVTAALQRETHTIPIVFVVVTDPVGEGFVEGLARPGGNITGFITSEAAMGSKMLDLLLDIVPDINRVAMLFNPDTAPGGGKYYLADFEAAARSSKVEPIAARAHSDAEIEAVVTSLGTSARRRSHCDAGFFHAKPCPANLVASSAKQCTHNLSLEVRRD
jgi:putative ABC transport system substrate-binding protein